MDFQNLKSIVDGQLSGNLYTLIGTDYSSDAITELTRRFCPDGQFTLDRATVEEAADQSTITIVGFLKETFFGQVNLKTTAILSIIDGKVQLRAEFTGFPTDWKISDYIAATNNTILNEFHFLNPTFILDSTLPNTMDENFQTQYDYNIDPAASGLDLKQGMSFKGQLVRADIPEKFQWILAGSDEPYLEISGPLMIKFGKLMLQWTSNTLDFELGGTTVPLELQFVMLSPDHLDSPAGWSSSRVFALLKTHFSFTEDEDETIEFPAYAVIESLNDPIVSVVGKAEPDSRLGITDLAKFMAGQSISEAIPSDFPVIEDIVLEEIGFQLNLLTKMPSSIWFKVGYDHTWHLFEDHLTIEDMSLRLLVNNPLEHPNLQVMAFGTLGIGSVDIDMQLWVNNMEFQASLKPGNTIRLTQMIHQLVGTLPSGLPEVNGTSFLIKGKIREKYFLFSTVLESDWEIDLGNHKLGFQKLSLELEYQGQTDTIPRSVLGNIYGEIKIAGASLFMSARKSSSGWELSGGTIGDSSISLTDCANEIATLFDSTLPAAVPDVSLKNLYLSFDTGIKTYKFTGEIDGHGTIPLAGNSFELQTIIDLTSSIDTKTNTRVLSGHIEAYLDVGKTKWTLRYEMGNNISKVTASWRATFGESLTIDELLDALGIGDRIDIPDELDPSLVEIALEYDHANSYATLSGRTKKHGDAFMTVGKQDGKWGFVFGINVTPTEGKASKLPAVGQYLGAADFMEIKQAGIIISTSQIRGYQVPALPLMMDTAADAGSALGNRPAQPVAASTALQLERGFTTVAVIDLDTQGEQGKTMAKALPSAQFPFQLTYSGTAVSFYTGLTGTISIPDPDNPLFSISNAGLKITRTITQEMTFSMMGGFDFTLFSQKINVLLSLNLELDGMSASINVDAGPEGFPAPPGLKGFNLIQLGLLMGITYQPPAVEMVLQGKFDIGSIQNNTNQFGIGMKFVQTPAWPTPVPVLSYLSFYIEEAGFDQLVTLVTDKPATGATGVLSNVKGYELSFYYCDDQTILPDGTIALPGIGFSGLIDFFGFGAYGEFNMMVDKGISGHAEIAPINLGNVLNVTGGGKGLKRTFKKVGNDWLVVKNNEPLPAGTRTIEKTIVKSGGAVVQFNALSSPFLYINWKISLFDLLEQEVVAEVSTSGITFQLLYAISNTLSFQIDCTLENWQSLKASASLDINVNMTIPGFKVNGVEIGDIKLQAGVDITISLELSPSKFHLGLTGKFNFQGSRFTVKVNLNAAPSDLKKIPKWIEDEILDSAEELFADLFDDVGEFVDMVGNGILDTGENTLEALSGAYNQTAEEFADSAKQLGKTTEEVGQYMKSGLGYTGEAVSSALQSAGYEAKEVWNFMQNNFNWFSHIDVPHADRKSEHFHGDVSQRFHADKKKHFDLKVAGKKVHADVGKTLGVDKKVSLTPHVDVKHTDLKPSYEKQHIDVKGVNIPKHKYGGQTLLDDRVNVGVGTKIKISKWKKHLDLGHLDERLKVTVPKVPTSHVDVGHVDVKSKLP